MILLLIFAFIGGVVTILSPCILPILPIILSSASGDRAKPYGIVTGFIGSFTFFTLFLASIVKLTGIPADSLRLISIFIIASFGVALLVPQFQLQVEKLFAHFANRAPNSQTKQGYWGGLLIGMSLGLLWTPCVGPILAGVISLALSGTITGQAFLITFAYATGTAIPMLIILKLGGRALSSVPWLVRNTGKIQKAFGILMILTALAIYFNIDRQFQAFVIEKFPQYGSDLTSIEDNSIVKNALKDVKQSNSTLLPQTNFPDAPEIVSEGKWFNTDKPLKISELTAQNKVVLVDFWTYTCINCIRTLPYLRDWWSKYKDDGLIIIGVHTPEFEFEKNADNLAKAIKDFNLTYPIVQDNNYKTWNAYSNRYWPAKYLIDKNGKIRYTHFGEGEYDQTEQMIQKLLGETGQKVTDKINNPEYQVDTRTPETYLGFGKATSYASKESISPNTFKEYSYPDTLFANHFALSGSWKFTDEYIESKTGSELELNYFSKNVFLVMESETAETQVEVYLDNKLTETISISANKLYDMVKQEEAGAHILKLKFLNDGTRVFAFTFG